MAASAWTRSVNETEAAIEGDRRAVRAALEAGVGRYVGSEHGRAGQAMRYALLGAGKLLRPILLLAAYRAAGGRADASALAASVEVVHAYSLVHDDLPCMDDDAVRRGRPTTHRVYGAPVAAVAGVAMVPLAALWAHDAALALGLPRSACADIVRELVRASGAGGMVGGQLLDLRGEERALTLEELEWTHRGKTAALIVAAARMGGIAAGADARRLSALERYGASMGLAFQIADDVLDATATTEQLGKTAGADAARRKSTYVSLLGVGEARERAARLVDEACQALCDAGLRTPVLERLARFAIVRSS